MATLPESEKKILDEVNYYKEKYFVFDLPVPLENFVLYPVPVRYYNEFMSASSCCTLNKNDDPKGVRMTSFEYLLSKMQDEEEGASWSMKFSTLIELCLHIKNGLKCPKCGKFISFEEYINKYTVLEAEKKQAEQLVTQQDIDQLSICECGEKFYETIRYEQGPNTKRTILILDNKPVDIALFNRIRKIIMYQNLPDFKDDSWVDKSVRDDQAAKQELLSKGQGKANLERKIIGVCANTNYKLEEIYELSIRKFLQILNMVDDIINYKTAKLGLMSGMVSLKKGTTLDHWLYQKETGLYAAAVDADAYTKQIKGPQS